ncbi:MAG: sigma-E processing peptidase SpoIIGA [Roseburia sp.]
MRDIYVFYVDLFLVQNFFMDFVALSGANFFLKRHLRIGRLFAVSLAASMAGLLCLLVFKNFVLYRMVVHVLINTLMILLGFGRCNLRQFLENWGVTYLAILVLGGILNALLASGFVPNQFFLQILLAAALGYGILLYLMQKKTFSDNLYLVTLRKDRRCMEVMAYWDTGNQLYDPYTGQAVSVLSNTKARDFFDGRRDRVRYVPYCSLGEQRGLLPVISIDELILFDGKQEIHMHQMAIGIAGEELLEKKEYDLILHGSML